MPEHLSLQLKQLQKKLEHPTFLTLLKKIEKALDQSPLPHLPASFVQTLANIIPWLAVIGGLMAIYGSFGTISFGMGSSWYLSQWVQFFTGVPRFYFVITGLANLLIGLLLVWSFRPLKDRLFFGWLLLAWSTTLSILTTVLSLLFSVQSFFTALVGTTLGVYLLFEVKSAYKKA